MDNGHLVIDLTDAAMTRRRAEACVLCHADRELFRLIGTADALCRECFADVHA